MLEKVSLHVGSIYLGAEWDAVCSKPRSVGQGKQAAYLNLTVTLSVQPMLE